MVDEEEYEEDLETEEVLDPEQMRREAEERIGFREKIIIPKNFS